MGSGSACMERTGTSRFCPDEARWSPSVGWRVHTLVPQREEEVVNRRLILAAALAGAVAIVPTFAGGAAGRATAAKQTAKVTLKEFSLSGTLLKPAVFGKASPLKAGQTTFTFNNTGKFAHNFTVVRTSVGATRFRSKTIAPGKSQTLTVNLKPGSYVAVCTLFNGFHQAAGMVKAFSVGKFTNGKWGS